MTSPRENHEAMAAAKSPTPGTRIYRAHRGTETDTVGMHWTTNKDVATGFSGAHTGLHEAVIDDPKGQVIPHGALSSVQFDPDTHDMTEYTRNSRMMGYDWEAEVRLRPGANLRMADDSTRTVEHGGDSITYKNLADHAVPKTPQHNSLLMQQSGMPHTQGSLLDHFVSNNGAVIGHYAAWDALAEKPAGRPGARNPSVSSFSQHIDDSIDAMERAGGEIGQAQIVSGDTPIGPGKYTRQY